jgi:hypothetical protein
LIALSGIIMDRSVVTHFTILCFCRNRKALSFIVNILSIYI